MIDRRPGGGGTHRTKNASRCSIQLVCAFYARDVGARMNTATSKQAHDDRRLDEKLSHVHQKHVRQIRQHGPPRESTHPCRCQSWVGRSHPHPPHLPKHLTPLRTSAEYHHIRAPVFDGRSDNTRIRDQAGWVTDILGDNGSGKRTTARRLNAAHFKDILRSMRIHNDSGCQLTRQEMIRLWQNHHPHSPQRGVRNH